MSIDPDIFDVSWGRPTPPMYAPTPPAPPPPPVEVPPTFHREQGSAWTCYVCAAPTSEYASYGRYAIAMHERCHRLYCRP